MSTIRQQRLAGLLFEELSILIAGELEDPLISMAQVTHVDVSRDLRNVRVYVSHDDGEVSEQQILQGLKRATPFLRREIATRCTMRAVPELTFSYDDTPQKASRVDELLRRIAQEREERSGDEGITATVDEIGPNTDSSSGGIAGSE
ncbi:MAG: 30S ribosome-binding factor RbfA [Caldilineaceae bacterium]